MLSGIRLIVGLGNPGQRYETTRHNVGVWFIEKLREHEGLIWREEKKFFGLCAQHPNFWLLKPSTFMNDSGKAVASLAKFYKIEPSSILIVHDDLDFPPGVIRLKEGGGAGGHNGLRSVTSHLQTPEFYRLRIGINHPGHRDDVAAYVLSDCSKGDREKIFEAIEYGIQVVPDLLSGDIQKAFRVLHQQ